MMGELFCDGVIDVSHHNGAIDWHAVADDGIVLAMIKATQGTSYVDPTFSANRTAARAAGILTVPYHFIDDADPVAQATHFITTANLGIGDVVMLDWENGAPAEKLVKIGESIVSATRRDPLAYYGWAQLKTADPKLSAWPLMLPAYPRGNTPGRYADLVTKTPHLPPGRSDARPYDFHQYTPAGGVKGISGPVDRSVWIGAEDELRAWYATGARPGVTAAPADDPAPEPVLDPFAAIPRDPTWIQIQSRLNSARNLNPWPDPSLVIDGDAGRMTRRAIWALTIRAGVP